MRNRQVVITRSSIAGAIGTLVGLLALLGVGVSDAQADQLVNVLVLAMPLVVAVGGALWSRLHVTPVFDPRDADGTPLVPTTQVSARRDELDDIATATALMHLDDPTA
ncbi:hypothetical protein [Angustibacter luteus]|uniref:Uncharacterized protein n=1 Tax=Angustibacter luteus TaxID=658456 RepID=A0ABW1JK85_9ACTN